MNNITRLQGEGNTSPLTIENLPLSLGSAYSFLEFHHSEVHARVSRLGLLAIRTSQGRWYRTGAFALPAFSSSSRSIKIGTELPPTSDELSQSSSLAESLTGPIHPIGSAIVEKTSVYLEPDSTISIVATVQNTTGQWLFGRGARPNCEDSLGVRILSARGLLVAECRVHFFFECVAPGERVELRGSIIWADLSLPPGLYTVALDVVREGVNWSRALLSSPQHALIIPDTIYRATYDLSRFHTTKRFTTLTFNAHADALYTEELLDILETMGVKATFFITGKFLKDYPRLVDRMVEQEHEIGNLTDTYQLLTYPGYSLPKQGITFEVVRSELSRVADAFHARYKIAMAPFWRAPQGARNGPLLQYATDVGFRHVSWSLDSKDEQANPNSLPLEEIAKRVEAFLSEPLGRGSIILFNASSNHIQTPLYDVIHRIVEFGWSKGYSFRTCGEMVEETKQQRLLLTYPRE